MQYGVTGEGPGLVLVHGASGDAESNWSHLVDRFSDQRTVMTPNLSGSGNTTDGGGPLTLDMLVEQVAAVGQAGTAGPVDLVGFSLGAVVAAAAAAKHPELVRRLVLVGGWVRHDDPRQQLNFLLWRQLWENDRSLFVRLQHLTGFSAAYLDRLGHAGLARSLASAAPAPGTGRHIDLALRADIRDRVHLVTVPTLVIGLGQDQMVPVEHSRDLHKGIPGSRYEELDTGHTVMAERPDEFATLLRDFLLED
ncbi:3-oxoadipate enol-lactone hydrolase [Longimycelium tulufanense]|uniref:3-oxoadipate enol-lactone hydrolase n=1 Tax=Longimycelium tulufanense TaxID=907463 RepID=A0A8J3C785_9PSEU|nr:3-oxoadipate enol-lactone hydrolase [Longimycelium tulufanense]